MKKRHQTILLAVLGVVLVCVIAIVAVGVWVTTSMVSNTSTDEAGAMKAMNEIRMRFAGTTPVLDVRPGSVVLSRRPPETKSTSVLKTLHVLRWNVHEENLSRVELPFALLRLRDSGLDVMFESNREGTRVKMPAAIHVSDIEAFGPALLIDGGMPDGGWLLVWSE